MSSGTMPPITKGQTSESFLACNPPALRSLCRRVLASSLTDPLAFP
jgi:hypothetical protein